MYTLVDVDEFQQFLFQDRFFFCQYLKKYTYFKHIPQLFVLYNMYLEYNYDKSRGTSIFTNCQL